jgi:hypothetical protein
LLLSKLNEQFLIIVYNGLLFLLLHLNIKDAIFY